jgi:hypothetical protein
MKYVGFLVFLAAILVSCQPSEQKIQTAIAQTKAAEPTATFTPPPTNTPLPTLVPLKDIDLEQILIKTGDLPAGMSSAQVVKEVPVDEGFPASVNQLEIQLAQDNKAIGFVRIFIFETDRDVEKAYTSLAATSTEYVKIENIDNLGESATAHSTYVPLKFGLAPIQFAEVIFRRCMAVVVTQFTNTSQTQGAINYGRRLDDRLRGIVCR